MEIRIKKDPRAEFVTVYADSPLTIEELISREQDKPEYTVLAAKKNNTVVPLTQIIDRDCSIEYLDMRNQAANLIYQNSVIMIYLRACRDVLGDMVIDVRNSISKGLFTVAERILDDNEIEAIESRMRELIAEDIPFVLEEVSGKEAAERFAANNEPEKLALISRHTERVRFYSLDGYTGFFYGMMVPSTGYIEHFELKKYRDGIVVRFPHPKNPSVIPEYVEEYKMHDTFIEATKWQDILGVQFVSDLNRKIETGEYRDLIQLSEALHEKKIAQIADMITEQKKRIILIAGPSSSGKTTFARRLCVQLRVNGLHPLYLGTDDYFVERKDAPLDEYGEKDFESLASVDVELFNSNMNDLLEGREVDLPEFDFITGCKVFGKRITRLKEGEPVVIEGIHALNDDLTPYIDADEKFKIYISPFTQLNIDRHNRIPTTDARMLRRMARDFQYRGYSAQDTIRQWPKVRAGEDRNIFPFSNCADVLFNSVHVYELSVLKKYVWPLLWQIKPDEPEYCEAVRLIKFLSYFRSIEDDSVIVNNSILREFIGGSIFVD